MPICRAIHLFGGAVDRPAVWCAKRTTQRFRRRGISGFYLLRLFCVAKVFHGVRRQRDAPTDRGGVAAEWYFWIDRVDTIVAGPVESQSHEGRPREIAGSLR